MKQWMIAGLIAAMPLPALAVSDAWVPKWQDDLAFVKETLPEAHVDLYDEMTPEQFAGAIDSLSARVSELAHNEITVELMRIIAMAHDGHTRLTMPLVDNTGFVRGHSTTPPPSDPALFFRHYPIRVYLFSDGVFVTRIGKKHARFAGARLVQIGRTPIDDAIAAVTPTIQRDNVMQIKRHLPERLVIPEILQARGVIDDMEETSFLLETADGKRHTVTLKPVAGAEVAWVDAAPTPAPLYLRDVDNNFWFEYLTDSRTVYWQYNTVYDKDDETVDAFALRLLEFIETHDTDRVVIDLRHNFGGNNGLNRALIHMLIRCTKTREPGTLFAIVGRGTFSAAMMFSVDLEKHTDVIFAGEPTGSTPNHLGDSRKTQMPNTGITIRASTLYHQSSGPRDDRPFIEPHIATPISSRDFLAGRDPAVDAILKASETVANPDPRGSWVGRVIDFRIAVHLEKGESGWSGTLDVPDQGAEGLPLVQVEFTAGHVGFVLPNDGSDVAFDAEFRGRLLVGTARLGRRAYPFALTRVSKP